MEKLTIQHIAAFGIEGVQFISELDKPYDEYGKQPVWTCNGITYLFGEYCLNTKEGNDAYPISKCKLVLRNISCLTKTIQHEGREFIPVVELAKIAFPDEHFIERHMYIPNWYLHGVCAKSDFYQWEFTFNNGSFYLDQWVETEIPAYESCAIENQYQLFQKIAEWHIDFLGFIEKGLAIEKDNTN